MNGKGAMIWRLRSWMGGDPDKQVAEARRLGLSWIAIKMQDGTMQFWESFTNYPSNQNWHLMSKCVPPLVAAGIEVGGWGWLYGRGTDAETSNLDKDIAVAEADATIALMRQMANLGAVGPFGVDAEAPYKELPPERTGMGPLAAKYFDRLEAGWPTLVSYLCSYRYPNSHTTFPWPVFAQRPEFIGQQVYWVEENDNTAGVRNLRNSIAQYDHLKPGLRFVPIGPTYLHAGYWRATAEQLRHFFLEAKTDGRCDGVGIWCLDLASQAQVDAWAPLVWDVAPPSTVPIEQWAREIDDWARDTPGVPYNGPRPA